MQADRSYSLPPVQTSMSHRSPLRMSCFVHSSTSVCDFLPSSFSLNLSFSLCYAYTFITTLISVQVKCLHLPPYLIHSSLHLRAFQPFTRHSVQFKHPASSQSQNYFLSLAQLAFPSPSQPLPTFAIHRGTIWIQDLNSEPDTFSGQSAFLSQLQHLLCGIIYRYQGLCWACFDGCSFRIWIICLDNRCSGRTFRYLR